VDEVAHEERLGRGHAPAAGHLENGCRVGLGVGMLAGDDDIEFEVEFPDQGVNMFATIQGKQATGDSSFAAERQEVMSSRFYLLPTGRVPFVPDDDLPGDLAHVGRKRVNIAG